MTEQAPETLVALYGSLANATAALDDLEAAGVPYVNIHMAAHTADELRDTVGRTVALPEQAWSIAVLVGEPLRTKAIAVLRSHDPFTLGSQPADHGGRGEVERGMAAWGHYVFEAVAATDQVGDAAGTAGTTGVISSGIFANKSVGEGNPSERAMPDQERG